MKVNNGWKCSSLKQHWRSQTKLCLEISPNILKLMIFIVLGRAVLMRNSILVTGQYSSVLFVISLYKMCADVCWILKRTYLYNQEDVILIPNFAEGSVFQPSSSVKVQHLGASRMRNKSVVTTVANSPLRKLFIMSLNIKRN